MKLNKILDNLGTGISAGLVSGGFWIAYNDWKSKGIFSIIVPMYFLIIATLISILIIIIIKKKK